MTKPLPPPVRDAVTGRTDREDIIVVRSKSQLDPSPMNHLSWEKHVMNRRVIPFPATAKLGFYEGKVRGENLVKLYFTVKTGICLRYKGKEWNEEHQIKILVPLENAVKIAEAILRTAKRHKK